MPHYVAAAPNPKAALALVRKLEGLVGVAVDATELESAAADYERQVNLAVQSDPDVQAFVERLEQAADEPERGAGDSLPSGDTIARDLQRFLRQRGGDERRPALGLQRASALGRRAHQPVVADRAGRERRGGLEALREDPVGDLHRDLPDPLAVVLVARHGDLLVVEQVVVGLLGGLEAATPRARRRAYSESCTSSASCARLLGRPVL